MTDQSLEATNQWSFGKKQAFRFFGLYFLLYLISTTQFLSFLYNGFIEWIGVKLHIWNVVSVYPNGSGDTTYNYVQLIGLFVVAFTGSIIWGLIDHKRKHYDKLLYWLMVILRYGLAYYMIIYGFAKIFIGQFPPPSLSRLMQPIGECSPMGIAWTFMGASRPFTAFTGIAEALGGTLLLFRRTTMMGGLFSIIVLANIVAMNFCYDIPVKLFSLHLLLITFFILIPDIPRLFSFFFLNRHIASKRYYPVFKSWISKSVWISLKLLVVGWIFYQQIIYNTEMAADPQYNHDASTVPMYGIYDVQRFITGMDTLTPVKSEADRWQHLVLDKYERATVTMMNGMRMRYEYTIDTTNKSVNLETGEGEYKFTCNQIDSTHFLFLGKFHKTFESSETRFPSIPYPRLQLLLERRPDTFLLTNRGFHWINEYPFNK